MAMNARTALPMVAHHGLEALLIEGRTPLDAALQLGHALLKALEAKHAGGQPMGAFDASSITVDALGQVFITPSTDGAGAAPELAGGGDADLLSDLYSLGAVFYRLFSGLSHLEATKRSGGHLPPPSRFNPTIDDGIDALVLTMLDADPMQRPYRLAQVEGSLTAVCDDMGLELDASAISKWVSAHRPPVVVTAAPVPAPQPLAAPVPLAKVTLVAPPSKRQSSPRIQWSLEEEDDEVVVSTQNEVAWDGPVRLDLWAAASAGVVALGVALIALL